MTDDIRSHYYGDSCVPPHSPSVMKSEEADSRTTGPVVDAAHQNRIDELMQSALDNHAKAYEYEDRANQRHQQLKQEELTIQRRRAHMGNPLSKRIMNSYDSGVTRDFNSLVDERCAYDAIWCGHVANNKFYTRKANLDNLMLQTILEALKMGQI